MRLYRSKRQRCQHGNKLSLMNAPEINFKITINGKDATKDLTPYILEFTYEDNTGENADELKIVLDNSDLRFSNAWFMKPGMTVKAWLGQMYCGQFSIDVNYESGPPDIAGFSAQSAEFNTPIRVSRSFTHYKKSLKDIVNKYAKDHKLTLVGTVPDLNLTTVTQFKQSDIHFLHALAAKYGCTCAVKGDKLIFDAIDANWKRDVVKTITKKDCLQYYFASVLSESTDSAGVAHYEPHQDTIHTSVFVGGHADSGDDGGGTDHSYNETFRRANAESHKYKYPDGSDYTAMDTDYDTANNMASYKYEKAESEEEAKLIALGDLLKKRKKKHTCRLTLPGDELLVAGNSTKLKEFGKRSGYWTIEKSLHKLDKAATYKTTIEIFHGAATTEEKVPSDKKVDKPIYVGGHADSGEYEKQEEYVFNYHF